MLGRYVMSRDATGTAWQPDSSPMSGIHFGSSNSTFMVHGFANAVYTREGGHRGDEGAFSTNMGMLMGRRNLRNGALGFRLMLSAEPSMGRRGYPLLLQTGETADGVTPLLDRQHPHDMLMELSGTWSRNFADGSGAFVYVAVAGDPPLGPPAFMHRASGADNPLAPITHHFLDSTHVTHGVVTAGITTKEGIKLEVGAFNGREPDQKRWGIQVPRLDSFAFRFTVNAHRNLSVQVSAGSLNDPEELHQGLDITRLTASAIYNRPLNHGNWQTTLAWGRNKRIPPTILPGASTSSTTHVHPVNPVSGTSLTSVPVQQGVLLETAANMANWHTVFARLELAEKDELFPPSDLRHPVTYSVTRSTVGYIYDFPFERTYRIGVGLSGSLTTLGTELQNAYGENPGAVAVFLRLRFAP